MLIFKYLLKNSLKYDKIDIEITFKICYIISVAKNYTQGYSSVGRAAVSKTACRGFKSFCPCQIYKACISRKTPKYRLFSYLYETVLTAILQLRVTDLQSKITRNHTKITRHLRWYNAYERSQLPLRELILFMNTSRKHLFRMNMLIISMELL